MMFSIKSIEKIIIIILFFIIITKILLFIANLIGKRFGVGKNIINLINKIFKLNL